MRFCWVLLVFALLPGMLAAKAVGPYGRARLAGGTPLVVVVEFRVKDVNAAALAARAARGLTHDDPGILALRAQGYAVVKDRVEREAGGRDAVRVLDYAHFPLAVWRLGSLAALERLETHPDVMLVHENTLLHPVSVSDLPFISQPQTAAEDDLGAGATIAVIDGGLGSNYTTPSITDFGTCTAVDTPASTCRVVFNEDVYPGLSSETEHGTNVSAIALGVAPGAKLAMFDVFNGASASSVDILNAMNTVVTDKSKYNIVALNLSLGDGTANASTCSTSIFAAAIDGVVNAGVTTVAAAGNSGSKSGLGDPACAPNVVSVGAVYDAGYGTVTWVASADSSGTCTDASAADHVACFSQSASYLSMLAPGTFVNAPNASFQLSGTSQATPHVSGAVAVLRARYPAETLAQTLQRLQASPIKDVDPASGIATPRLDLLAAVNLGTTLTLSGTGPVTATAGGTGTYTLTATNAGPLIATDAVITDILPAGATLVSTPAGCTLSGDKLTCVLGTLAIGGSATVTINVKWTVTGPVYDSAGVTADQVDSATAAQQEVAFGVAPPTATDGPVPPWSYGLLGAAMALTARRRLGRTPATHFFV